MKPVGLDSREAVTIFSSVVIPRSNLKEALSEIDLENYVSQAIWKFFDRYRKEAAERLSANEIDLVLNEARVVGVRIDGHRVLNPVGFAGKEVEMCLAGTIMKRENVQESVPAFELGTIRAYLLSRERELKNILYIEVLDELSRAFLYSPRYTSFLDEFAWGKNDIVKSISSAFKVSPEVAEVIYAKYLSNETSVRVSKFMNELFRDTFLNFIKNIDSCLGNFKSFGLEDDPSVLVRSFPLPEEIYRKRFHIGKNVIKISKAEDLATDDLIRDHIYNAYADLNLLAQRRLKWLISSSV